MTIKSTVQAFIKAYDWVGKQLERVKWGATIIGIIIACSHWQSCQNRIADNASWKSILAMKDATIEYYKQGDRTIAQIQEAKVDRSDFEALAKQDKQVTEQLAYAQIKAKNADALIVALQKTSLPATDINLNPVYTDPPISQLKNSSDTMLKSKWVQPLYFTFLKDTTLYHIEGIVNNKVLHLKSFNVFDTLGIVTGEKRKNIFSRSRLMLTINHSDPYVSTNKIEGYDITPHKYFFQTTVFKIGVGILVGGFIVHELK